MHSRCRSFLLLFFFFRFYFCCFILFWFCFVCTLSQTRYFVFHSGICYSGSCSIIPYNMTVVSHHLHSMRFRYGFDMHLIGGNWNSFSIKLGANDFWVLAVYFKGWYTHTHAGIHSAKVIFYSYSASHRFLQLMFSVHRNHGHLLYEQRLCALLCITYY